MTFQKLRDVMRTVLGDRQVHGAWNYPDADLDGAIKAVFLLNRGPAGFRLNVAEDQIDPEFTTGDQFALVCYDACLLRIGGEDGAIRVQTRAVTLADEGHRKRDLLYELREQIYVIRDGGAVFSSFQELTAFLNSFGTEGNPLLERPGSEVNVSPGPDLTV